MVPCAAPRQPTFEEKLVNYIKAYFPRYQGRINKLRLCKQNQNQEIRRSISFEEAYDHMRTLPDLDAFLPAYDPQWGPF